MKRLRALFLIILTLTLASTSLEGATAAAQEKNPINLCIHLYPSGPKTKPPVLAIPKAGNKCAADFKLYQFPTLEIATANLNAIMVGSFNSGLALGVYTAAQELKKGLTVKK
jgi:hypothetical protein